MASYGDKCSLWAGALDCIWCIASCNPRDCKISPFMDKLCCSDCTAMGDGRVFELWEANAFGVFLGRMMKLLDYEFVFLEVLGIV